MEPIAQAQTINQIIEQLEAIIADA
ncbi:MAG: hypothetical protein JWQ57_1096, partial [Mucilaginibacter sp.]|nr:hypothetical protein [Mucilaginibacter sp.]